MRIDNALLTCVCVCVGVCVALASAAGVSVTTTTSSCDPDKMTVYKVVMHTFWTRQLFPKHYPDWRPPAQWSKLIGRSHNAQHTLFRVGTRASPGIKEFAETGQSGTLDSEAQGNRGVLDMFTGPPIYEGAGRAEAQFFLDGNHSRVSLMARIVPSPDWFVGIDSFELCMESSWLDSITIEVDPMDAGTDNGFTFTAPNWATEPQGVIYRITSHYPPHPAGSFYYPYMKRLPPIATFQFIKLREYELSEVFHHSEDDKRYDLMRADQKNVIVNNLNSNQNNQNNDVQIEMEVQRREQEMRLQQQQLFTTRLPVSPTSVSVSGDPLSLPLHQQLQNHLTVVPGAGIIPRGDKDAILNSIVETYHNQEPLKQKNKNKKALRKLKAARECRVGEWGEWSECSVSCGVGEMTRHRTVERHPRRGGKSCPPLTQTKWCGAANNNCPPNSIYSNW